MREMDGQELGGVQEMGNGFQPEITSLEGIGQTANRNTRKLAQPTKQVENDDEGWGDAGALLDWPILHS